MPFMPPFRPPMPIKLNIPPRPNVMVMPPGTIIGRRPQPNMGINVTNVGPMGRGGYTVFRGIDVHGIASGRMPVVTRPAIGGHSPVPQKAAAPPSAHPPFLPIPPVVISHAPHPPQPLPHAPTPQPHSPQPQPYHPPIAAHHFPPPMRLPHPFVPPAPLHPFFWRPARTPVPLEKQEASAQEDKNKLRLARAERDRLFNEEKKRIQDLVDNEVVPEGKVLGQNPNSLDHIRNVVDVVGLALHLADDGNSTLQTNLQAAREFVSGQRNGSAKASESLILRDAERYLFGRSGPTQFPAPIGGPDATRAVAGLGRFVYDMDKVFSLLTHWDFLKANKDLPFSAMGGSYWFRLGLEHWDQFDRGSAAKVEPPHFLSYDEVIQHQSEAAGRKAAEHFDPNTGQW